MYSQTFSSTVCLDFPKCEKWGQTLFFQETSLKNGDRLYFFKRRPWHGGTFRRQSACAGQYRFAMPVAFGGQFRSAGEERLEESMKS
jgi:hypothetical protein